MPSLSRELRRLLERTIAGTDGARQIAEAGAEQSLQRLAVDRHEPHSALTVDERTLRNQLRAHGRQLGDKRDLQRGTQTIDHLKQAVAYEHWHRLLFARFLAENNLLMHPEHGVALTLDEVKELALGKGCDWIELAAEYAQKMLLREVFRSDDPALRVLLSPEKRRDLESKLNQLPREIFLADDSLGWVYQFWQRDAKEIIDRSGTKIGADELSPVTQLFTEDYMVLFLLENTLGAWWTVRRGSPNLAGYEWTYLRLNEDGTPAAGPFEEWPKTAKELRVLDPCMGSGHFLTFALPILTRMRETEEELTLADAVSAVLRDNLLGLELDPRCSQIAAFNLALTAWKLAGHYFELPALRLACSGLGINSKEDDWLNLAGADSRAKETMRGLYRLFSDAPVLGSLIDPTRFGANLFTAEFREVSSLLERALASEEVGDEAQELAIAAQGLLAAAKILSDKFTLLITNVPYLGRGKQAPGLALYCEENHREAKGDLATCFLDRCLRLCSAGGTVAAVIPQTWLFLKTFAPIRSQLLSEATFSAVVKLGANAFRDMNWWAAVTALNIIMALPPKKESRYLGLDVGETKDQIKKADLLCSKPLGFTSQSAQLQNPQYVITFRDLTGRTLLREVATSTEGLSTGDGDRYLRKHWELPTISTPWEFFQVNPEKTASFTGMSEVILWEEGQGELSRSTGARIQGHSVWGGRGVLVSSMNRLCSSLYLGTKYDKMCVVIAPKVDSDLAEIWRFVASPDFHDQVRQITQKVHVATGTFIAVPFDKQSLKSGMSSDLPRPESSDPTQWLFDGNPAFSEFPLQVGVARLLGYRWPRQNGSSIPDCPVLEVDDIELQADDDGIVCLPAIAGKDTAAMRLRKLLQLAFGTGYDLQGLLSRTHSANLDLWLRDEFFAEHCRLFESRPFLWHIWDGRKDGFHALVNYHRLDRKNLEKLIFSYLGDWLNRQRQDVRNGVEGSDTRVAAAEHLQGELEKILEGASPFDIFVRWKSVDKQAIGWEPDLNDGVRMNIRPWLTEAKLYKASKPGILRVTPNIKYTKDRGQEPPRDNKEFPWFAKSTDRVNDVHLSLDEKRRARGLS